MTYPAFRDIYRARQTIAPHVRRTPLLPSPALGGAPIWLKLESAQHTGAFKLRGAANKMLSLSEAERARGVVAVSTGNHGRAVAHMGRALGIRVVVCISELVPAVKRAAIEDLGAEVHVAGAGQEQAMVYADELVRKQGLAMVPPFDDPHIIAGQGTIGLEIVEDAPEVTQVVVPLSGGGLVSGIALAIKSIDSGIRVVAVSAEASPGMIESLRAGRPMDIPEEASLADSLGGGLGQRNDYTMAMVERLVDVHVTVSEDEIARAMAFAFRHHRLVTEGGGAVAIAAQLAGKVPPPPATGSTPAVAGPTTVLVVSGGNIDPDHFLDIVGRHPA